MRGDVKLAVQAVCSASFDSIVCYPSNLEEQVSVVVPRAKDDLPVGDDTQGGNIEVVRLGEVQDLELSKEMFLSLRCAGASVEC